MEINLQIKARTRNNNKMRVLGLKTNIQSLLSHNKYALTELEQFKLREIISDLEDIVYDWNDGNTQLGIKNKKIENEV